MSLRMTGTRASHVLDSRSKQIPLILKAIRKRLQRSFHTRYTLARFGNSWQSLGAHTKILAAEYGDTTHAGTVEHGVRGPVDGYLPRKEPGFFAIRERAFELPPEGGLFLSPEGVRYS